MKGSIRMEWGQLLGVGGLVLVGAQNKAEGREKDRKKVKREERVEQKSKQMHWILKERGQNMLVSNRPFVATSLAC